MVPKKRPKRGHFGVISCVRPSGHSVPESFTSKTPSFGVSFGVSFGSKRVSFGSVLGHFRPGFKWMVRQGGPDHGIQEWVQKEVKKRCFRSKTLSVQKCTFAHLVYRPLLGHFWGKKGSVLGSVLGRFWVILPLVYSGGSVKGGPDHGPKSGVPKGVQKWVSLCDLPTPKHFMEFSGVNTKIHEIK